MHGEKVKKKHRFIRREEREVASLSKDKVK
jgi:hypothetical protein